MSEDHSDADRTAPAPQPSGDPGGSETVGQFPALQALAGLEQRPLAEHADVYQQLHSELQGALAEIDGM